MKSAVSKLENRLNEIKETALKDRITVIGWKSEADDILKLITAYWSKIGKSEKKSIGLFDIRWDDAATNHAIEFDFEENNDPDEIMIDGANKNEPVINFAKLFKKISINASDSAFDEIKDILCDFVSEIIIASTESAEFASIKKKKQFYIAFSKFHDDEGAIIFDSSETKAVDVAEGLDIKAFIKACKKGDVATTLKMMPRLEKLEIASERDKFLSAAADLYIDCWRSGKDEDAIKLLIEFMRIQTRFGPSTKKIDPMDGLNTAKATIPEALIIGAINSRNKEMIDLSLDLLPLKLTHPTLAFNVACLWAKKKEKEKMLEYAKQALKLKKMKREFLADDDFKPYHSDPDFKKLMAD